ncbi:MAG: YceI family protein [Acidimicrobiia bacterium]
MRRGERGGIVSFLMFAVVLVVAGAAACWWFFVRSEAAPPPKLEDTQVVTGGILDGRWVVLPELRSFVQYRVKQQLADTAIETDATARTTQVSGSMTIAGTTISGVTVHAQVSTLTSDQDRRDRYLRDNALQSKQFPTATFVLTQPITLAQAPQKGAKVTTDATGDFTLHGITKCVTIPLVGRWDGTTVQVVGELPIRFMDYGITPPSIGGFVSVGGNGRMELQLFFTKG